MDWVRKTQGFASPDVKNLYFHSGRSKVLKKVYGHLNATAWKDCGTDEELNRWLEDNVSGPERLAKGLAILLAGRAEDRLTEVLQAHNPTLLRYLPWGRATFDNIARRMLLSGSAVYTICTGGTATFNRTNIVMGSERVPAIVYNLRSVNDWPGDMALSVTYLPATHSVYATMFGCTPEVMDKIEDRLSNAGDTLFHPLLLPGIFAELERQRHIALVESAVTQRSQFMLNLLRNNTYDWKLRADDEEDTSTTDSVDLWMDICGLRNALKNWKEQLLSMIAHVDELADAEFRGRGAGHAHVDPQVATNLSDRDAVFRNEMWAAGMLIKERLIEITSEYEEKIRDCDMIMDGMSLATNLAHAKTNMEIAVRTKRDGSQMKSIALLTMVFLPATFVATLFSTSFFTWKPSEDDSLVSRWFWVYVVVSMGLTFVTVGLWYFCVNSGRRTRRASADTVSGKEKV